MWNESFFSAPQPTRESLDGALMTPELNFRERVEGVVGRYLRGEIRFDAAADEIAGVLRSIMTAPTEPEPRRPPGPLKIKPLTVTDWMNPRATEASVSGVLHASPLVPGGSSKEKERAQTLLLEAARRAESAGGGAV